MSNSRILWPCFIIILALFGKYLQDMGIFRRIQTKGIDKCRLIVPTDGEDQAFEDLAIDYDTGIAYMAGDNRMWFDEFDLSIPNVKKQGKVFTFNIESETYKKLDLIDYPYDHFHPLGINLLKGNNNQLFMTNYRMDNEEIVGTVDIFQLDSSNENQLKFIDSVVHPLFTAPDDVLAIDEKTFYVTNVYHYRKDKSVLMYNFELFTKRPWTNLLLCTKTNEWQCKIVIDSIGMANGIAASLDLKTIYVAATMEKQIRVYERHPENNSLSYLRSLSVPFLVDNIFVNDYDHVIAAGHPKAIAFLLHGKNPQKYRAPSEVVLFLYPKSDSTFQNILLTNGELLSASTVAATYQQKLLVGALWDSGLLLCRGLF